jgi:hypothetical protein
MNNVATFCTNPEELNLQYQPCGNLQLLAAFLISRILIDALQ